MKHWSEVLRCIGITFHCFVSKSNPVKKPNRRKQNELVYIFQKSWIQPPGRMA